MKQIYGFTFYRSLGMNNYNIILCFTPTPSTPIVKKLSVRMHKLNTKSNIVILHIETKWPLELKN